MYIPSNNDTVYMSVYNMIPLYMIVFLQEQEQNLESYFIIVYYMYLSVKLFTLFQV